MLTCTNLSVHVITVPRKKSITNDGSTRKIQILLQKFLRGAVYVSYKPVHRRIANQGLEASQEIRTGRAVFWELHQEVLFGLTVSRDRMGDQMDIDVPQAEVKQEARPREPVSASPMVSQELMKTYYGQCGDVHGSRWVWLLICSRIRCYLAATEFSSAVL